MRKAMHKMGQQKLPRNPHRQSRDCELLQCFAAAGKNKQKMLSLEIIKIVQRTRRATRK